MSEEADLAQALVAEGLSLAGPVSREPGETPIFYVFVEAQVDKTGTKRPSQRLLQRVADEFLKQGVTLRFVLVENAQEPEVLQISLRAMLDRNFPDMFENVHVFSASGGAAIWIEPKQLLDKELEEAVAKKCMQLVDVLNVSMASLDFTTSSALPTFTACLNALRLKAPVNLAGLANQLMRNGFSVPNKNWLMNVLDRARKAGFIIRNSDKTFALTFNGLQTLGTHKGRRSPDVARALDLGRHRE